MKKIDNCDKDDFLYMGAQLKMAHFLLVFASLTVSRCVGKSSKPAKDIQKAYTALSKAQSELDDLLTPELCERIGIDFQRDASNVFYGSLLENQGDMMDEYFKSYRAGTHQKGDSDPRFTNIPELPHEDDEPVTFTDSPKLPQ